ncbi:LysR substrate-binding domain-containing protein [Caulobacter sp. UNC279MFTsu5.1]|uniref:LysR substrate-binding domain-containing protein n=1 Tax=Caulobacter sp. UNC279MFTsu5.1 TaxID=1502775 RepID=UPI00037A3555|nr:LysR substrate-binding domain-containing protein [Caulobacter sp. UNC279MFTsu5.1]SFI86346.1 DNA-binding transcriptional regulator, LysR family [Caulobacter sp. UNC279MFTsu5.1]
MDRDLIVHFPVVLAVARQGGFAAAAAVLGMSPSAVSHAVKTVEERLGLPLLIRTTRSVALTEAGARFVAEVGPALAEVDEAIERLRASRGRVAGVLRLNVPRVALEIALTPVIAQMARRHPDLVIEVTSDDGLIDIVAGGYDAGVRLGEMIARDMTAVRLTLPFKAIMVAAPAYLQSRGAPGALADLGDHNCIGFRLVSTGGDYAWEVRENGVDTAVRVRGSARVTDPLYARDLALAGVGVAYVFEPLVREAVREGRLRWLLPETAIEEPGLFLYFPRRAAQAPKLRAFIDMAREVLGPRR